MTEPFPFDHAVDRAVAAGDLDALTELIDTAAREKVEGYGPPQDSIRRAIRKFNTLYQEQHPGKVRSA